jgi:hypothetical protein
MAHGTIDRNQASHITVDLDIKDRKASTFVCIRDKWAQFLNGACYPMKPFERPAIAALIHDPAPTIALALIGLAGALAAKDSWYDDRSNLLLLLVLGCIGAILYVRQRLRIRRIRLPDMSESKYFYPFLSNHEGDEGKNSNENSDQFLIERRSDSLNLMTIIKNRKEANIILTGKSGVGKSTLVMSYVSATDSKKLNLHITEYDHIVYEILDYICGNLEAHEKSLNRPLRESAKKLRFHFDNLIMSQTSDTSEFTLESEQFFEIAARCCADSLEVIFVFDQFERFVNHFGRMELIRADKEGDRVSYCVGLILDRIRRFKCFVPLYIVRAEFATECASKLAKFTFFESLQLDEIHAIEGVLLADKIRSVCNIFWLHGINSHNNLSAFQEYEKRLRGIFRPIHHQKISQILGLHSPTNANTFNTQLTGYMLEHFVGSDKQIESFARGTVSDHEFIFDKFIDYLAAEFVSEFNAPNMRYSLELVLFSIAAENHQTKMALTEKEIAQLAHFPIEDVSICIEYLLRKRVLVGRGDSPRRYRIAHDLLSEHIVRSEHLSIRNDHRVSILQLVESKIAKDNFVLPEKLYGVGNFFQRDNFFDFAKWSVRFFIACCLLRLAFPEVAFELMKPVNLWINHLLPGSVLEFDFGMIYYLPIILIQIFWVNYMYYLDRGYFRYVLRDDPVAVRLLSNLASPAGGLAGFISSFAPSLMAVPIMVGAIGCGLVYWFHSNNGAIDGATKANSRELAWKIGFMVLIMGALTLVLYRVLLPFQGNNQSFEAVTLIWLTSACLLGYWLAMRSRQGSQPGRSSLLTIYDRSRLFA